MLNWYSNQIRETSSNPASKIVSHHSHIVMYCLTFFVMVSDKGEQLNVSVLHSLLSSKYGSLYHDET